MDSGAKGTEVPGFGLYIADMDGPTLSVLLLHLGQCSKQCAWGKQVIQIMAAVFFYINHMT